MLVLAAVILALVAALGVVTSRAAATFPALRRLPPAPHGT